jgi:transposase
VAPSKKNARRLGAYLVFADESGFLLIPTVRRTWAPRGQTPRLRHSYRHDRISALSAISVSPRRRRLGLYYQLYDHNVRRREVYRFVRHLLRHLRGPIFLLWDNIATHRGEPIRRLRARHRRLQIVPLPAYAPELNPDEGVWRISKSHLANGQPEHLDRLWGNLTLALEELRDSPAKLRSCIHQSELPPFLL